MACNGFVGCSRYYGPFFGGPHCCCWNDRYSVRVDKAILLLRPLFGAGVHYRPDFSEDNDAKNSSYLVIKVRLSNLPNSKQR